jgi:hypothetical protein
MAGALAWFWVLHSHYSEGRQRLKRVLNRPNPETRETAPSIVRVRLACFLSRETSRGSRAFQKKACSLAKTRRSTGDRSCIEAEREALRSDLRIAFWEELKKHYLLPAEKRAGAENAEREKRAGRAAGLQAMIDYALASDRD